MLARSRTAGVGLGMLLSFGCAGAPAVPTKPAPNAASSVAKQTSADIFAQADKLFESSQYASAEARFKQLAEIGPDARTPEASARVARARLGLARIALVTGRYTDAISLAEAASELTGAALIVGKAMRSQGRLEPAIERLEAELTRVKELPAQLPLAELLGEILLDTGQRERASQALMRVIEAYNDDHIQADDVELLALVGRAAQLLRSPRDSNDAYKQAESAGELSVGALLWRAELFLERYDPGHAEDVLREILVRAPDHPEAAVLMAHVRLAQALDFDAAERWAKKALDINPKLPAAYFVLAGISLRDMEIGKAEAAISSGLEHNPRDLELLSLHAAARFLADDIAGFEQALAHVLSLNAGYSRVYQIVGEYAEWEHRYEEIVAMMDRAVALDSEDDAARAQLGLNLIRAGDDKRGLAELQQAFAGDPFNVRVFNTLHLYEETIPAEYVSAAGPKFVFRYPTREKPYLERYLPALLTRAFSKMERRYGFTPTLPVGIELYSERRDFSVRTSGLPQTAIQGVCFGKTLASMSLGEEQFNLGMTLWHELAHVFHIQLSKAHVPRWFTEGLAEYETLIERPEWAREHDLELFQALQRGRVPRLTAMNQAFTRAEEMSDVTTAYYASTKIVAWLAERYGFDKLVEMLRLWGAGKRTEEVLQTALGSSPEELDAAFRQALAVQLQRYARQFLPDSRVLQLGDAKVAAQTRPKDANAQRRLALAFFEVQRTRAANEALQRALRLEPSNPDTRFLQARFEFADSRAVRAAALLLDLVKDGHDGYQVQLLLGRALELSGSASMAVDALKKASAFDPSQSDPHQGLLRLARAAKDRSAELVELTRLAALEEHAAPIYRSLMGRLVETHAYKEAVNLGEAAIYADMSGLETHLAFARALEATGQQQHALQELESAVACPADPKSKAQALAELAAAYKKAGRPKDAAQQLQQLKLLEPGDPAPGRQD